MEVEYVAVTAAESLRGLGADDAALIGSDHCHVGLAQPQTAVLLREEVVMFRYEMSFTWEGSSLLHGDEANRGVILYSPGNTLTQDITHGHVGFLCNYHNAAKAESK
jgi:hypothetical protein